MPYGYRGAGQFKLLKRQIDAVGDNGLIVIIAPPLTYLCPPATYVRASIMG